MTKWLRKYNKVLLVVAGVFLMVGFLLGPAINQFGPNPLKRTEAWIGPNKARAVRGMDLMLANQELEALRDFLGPISGGPQGRTLLNIAEVQDEVHWFLLVEEARGAGLVASQNDGAAWMPQLAESFVPIYTRERFIAELDQRSPGLGGFIRQNPQFAEQFDPERLRAIFQEESAGLTESRIRLSAQQAAASNRLTPDQFDQALTKLRGVIRMLLLNVAAPDYSDRRAAVVVRRLQDSASVDALLIDGARVAAHVAPPSAQDIEAHFQQYRETMPGTGEHGLGYLQPPRARLAWITLDRAAITAAVENTEIPADQLLERWSRNRLVYPGEFTAEIERLRADARAGRATEVLDLARRSMIQRVHRHTQGLPRLGPYFTLPDSWTPPDLEAIARGLAEDVASSTGVTIPFPPVTILNGRWQNRSDLAQLPGVGQSAMRQGAAAVPFSDVVLAVRELAGDNPLGIQAGVPHAEQLLEDRMGNLYLLMVLDSRPIGPADSIDEVIDEVRHDLIRLRGYAMLTEQLPALRATAVAEGLEAVAALFPPEDALPDPDEPAGPLVVEPNRTITGAPSPNQPPPHGSPEFRRLVMEAARGLDYRIPAADQPADGRTVGVQIPEALGVAVAQVVWFSPFTAEDLRVVSRGSMIGLNLSEWGDLSEFDIPSRMAMQAFTPEELKTRWNWVKRE